MIKTIKSYLEPLRDPTRAAKMSAYMRNQFAFLGIPAAVRARAVKAALQELGVLKTPLDTGLVLQLWALPEREYQYAACEYVAARMKTLDESHLDLLEACVLSKSWWDTIDSLDAAAGEIVLRFPKTISRLETWAVHENFWLRRMALQHQLAFKDKTNQERLFAFILANIHDQEFFIRKSIGWALREYAYTNPKAVQDFVLAHPELSALSKREALRRL
jgi:3-methyladenine DNA glycosylase AlkD